MTLFHSLVVKVYTRKGVYVHKYICLYVCIYVVYMYIYIYIILIYTYMYTHMYICTYVHMHIYIYIFTLCLWPKTFFVNINYQPVRVKISGANEPTVLPLVQILRLHTDRITIADTLVPTCVQLGPSPVKYFNIREHTYQNQYFNDYRA
jgi:hypothetical protein